MPSRKQHNHLRLVSYLPLHSLIFAASWLLTFSGCSKYLEPERSIEVARKGLHTANISRDSQYLVAASINHGGSLWRIQDGERLYNWNHNSGAFSTIVAADFSLEGKWAATAEKRTMVRWNVASGEASRYWLAPADIFDIAISSNGRYALIGLGDSSAVLFDMIEGGIKRKFYHNKVVLSVDFSADSRLALSGSADQTAVLWRVADSKKLATFRHRDEVQLVKLSPDGSLALTVGKYDSAILWNTDTGERLAQIPLQAQHLKHGIRFTAASFSDDNEHLLTGRPDQKVTLWETQHLSPLQHWQLPKRNAWKPVNTAVLTLAFTGNNNKFLAVTANGFLHYLVGDSHPLE